MSASPKMSRNRQRKTLYSAQADNGSRNQNTIDGPIVGRFEIVTVDEETGRKVSPYRRVVHDSAGGKAPAPSRSPKRSTNARRERRQRGALARREARGQGSSDEAATLRARLGL